MRTGPTLLETLMRGSLAGDAKAHRAMLIALAPILRAYFTRLSVAPFDAEDLVQETLIAIHSRRASYDPARPLAPWFYAIARYKLIDAVRRRKATVPIDGLEEMLGDEGFEASLGAELDVATLLATLPAKQAAAIRHTRIEGLSTSEAAERGGISESDVKVSVHRGLKALGAKLDKSS